MKIIGIDLGTTNSCVAIMENNNAKVIENSEGNRTTPSVVAYSKDCILVGAAAKRQSVTNSENTFFAIKRFIGRKFSDPEVIKNKKFSPYKIIESVNGDAWVQTKEGKILAPQQVSSEILKKMRKTAEDYFGSKISEAVITVPAYFNDSQRQATKDSGKIAGLNVKRIINEPTAAALAFGLDKNISEERKIAVYDLGGGTFDISVIEISKVENEKQFEVLSTNGDTFLGGEDFDSRITKYISDYFYKSEGIDIKKDKLALQRLREASEKCKIELSILNETEVNLPYICVTNNIPKHLKIKIPRFKLESLVNDLIDKTLETCKNAINDANLKKIDIDDVILVGGMTRMPIIQKKVQEFFNKKPRKDINPDEAVAIGAAIQAQVLSGDRKDILLLDVTPLSLGIETLGGVMTKMINKNTTIPTRYSQVFSTSEDNQPSVTIKIFQGERNIAEKNKLLGEFNLEGISPGRKGTPQIEVVFDIDANGILAVSAKDKITGKENKVTIKANTSLSEKEIEEMIKDAKINEEKDNKKLEIINLSNKLNSSILTLENLIEENKEKILNLNEIVKKKESIKLIKKNTKEELEKDIIEIDNITQKLREEIGQNLNKN